MKTIRLLYPDHVSGGLEAYHFGANLLQHILPANPDQPLVRVELPPPDGREKAVSQGIYALDEVLSGIRDAQAKLAAARPDRVITLGGNCLVSLAPFDYLRGLYPELGIIWIDAHPDVSTVQDGYPYAHAMVLGALMGHGAPPLRDQRKNPPFRPDQLLYVGLQPMHAYQEQSLRRMGIPNQVQGDRPVDLGRIRDFLGRFDRVLVHLDVDVLDERRFHDTYFANPDLSGDGSGGGKLSMQTLADVLATVTDGADVVGFTIAEYLPFDAYRLHKLFAGLPLFTR